MDKTSSAHQLLNDWHLHIAIGTYQTSDGREVRFCESPFPNGLAMNAGEVADKFHLRLGTAKRLLAVLVESGAIRKHSRSGRHSKVTYTLRSAG